MIRIYVHGRPQGQDTWSAAPAQNDKFYLNPFLDSKIGEDMNAVMQVDVWQNNSYYSYIHRKNVFEKGNRPNAYFAITVCFEQQLCTQVATLYDLLESVYSQICLNNILEKNGDQERFLIAQFKEKESVLTQVSNVILQNIEKYIANGLITIDKAVDTTKTTLKTYSTVDVDSPQFLADCAANRVLVSPYIVSKDRLPVELRQQILNIESQMAKIEGERSSWQSKAEQEHREKESLSERQKQLQEQIEGLQQQIKAIKGEVSKEYQQQLQELQKKLDSLMQERKRIEKELLQERNTNKSLSAEIDKLRSQTSRHPKGKPDSQPQPIPKGEEDYIQYDIQEQLHKLKYEVRRMAGRFSVPNSTISMVATLLNTAILIAIVVLYSLGNHKANRNVAGEIEKVHDTIVQESSVLDVEMLPDYSSARIDIGDFSGGDLSINKPYTLQLLNAQGEFVWQIKGADAEINGNTFVVKQPSDELTIFCIDSHNYIVSHRKIKAQ